MTRRTMKIIKITITSYDDCVPTSKKIYLLRIFWHVNTGVLLKEKVMIIILFKN